MADTNFKLLGGVMNVESYYDDDISKLIIDINNTNWDDEWFDPVKAHICCRLSQLSYLAIPKYEFEKRGRFKIIPSDEFQRIMRGGITGAILTEEKLSTLISQTIDNDGATNAFVISGPQLVHVGVRVKNIIFVAVRGTAQLYESSKLYDIGLDLNIRKVHIFDNILLHKGFYSAAMENLQCLYKRIHKLADGRSDVKVIFTGHSLGGAIAAILTNHFQQLLPNTDWAYYPFIARKWARHNRIPFRDNLSLHSSYTFGTPRIMNLAGTSYLMSPYTICHANDIIANMPPKTLNYADFTFRLEMDLDSYSIREVTKKWSWKNAPLVKRVLSKFRYHNVNNYVLTCEHLIKLIL
ncbi:lipase family protein [Pectobacteriaceae bacterium CE70]|nr:lipase family protein [Pectobacteriaceae bacterium C52]WJV67906.1 lipase family protein [Pectobacteriaceae bacterium CE70]WJY11851.1 lipase family protein [Pectobacteriaceae bacterium C80]